MPRITPLVILGWQPYGVVLATFKVWPGNGGAQHRGQHDGQP